MGTMIELLVFTGQRRQQIATLTGSMLDFDAKIITWAPECMKNARRHAIPMSERVSALLQHRAGLLPFSPILSRICAREAACVRLSVLDIKGRASPKQTGTEGQGAFR
jgi:integrase